MSITPALALVLVASPAQESICLAAAPAEPGASSGHSVLRVELDDTDAALHVDGEPVTWYDSRDRVLLVEEVAWTDVVVEVSEGEIQKLVRRFDVVRGGVGFDPNGGSVEEPDGTSPLEHSSVVFERHRDEVVRSFLDGRDDPGALAGLALRPNLAGLLPAEPVEVGERWTADPNALGAALFPLGRVPLDGEAERQIGLAAYTWFSAPFVPLSAAHWFGAPGGDAVDGDLDLELAGVETIDGTRVAYVEIAIDVRSKAELASWLEGILAEGFRPTVHRVDVEAALRGKGRLVWDVSRGEALSFEVAGDLDLVLDAAWRLQERSSGGLEVHRKSIGTLSMSLELEDGGR